MPTDMLTTEELLHETPEAVGKEESLKGSTTLAPELLRKMNAYWRAANYLSVGQIYLYDNPLLKEPLNLSMLSRWWLALGNDAGTKFHLCAFEPNHQKV